MFWTPAFANHSRPRAAYKKGYKAEKKDSKANKQVQHRNTTHFQRLSAANADGSKYLRPHYMHIEEFCNF